MIDYFQQNKKVISTIGVSLGVGIFLGFLYILYEKSRSKLTSESFFNMAKSNLLVYPTKSIRRISSFYGDRIHPITKKSQFHNGIDIPALPKTPIYAPINATVVVNNYNDLGGHQLVIANGDIRLGFAHLYEKSKFKVGDKVKKGEIIGLIGNTGRSTGSHLHFTLKIDGKWVNPTKAFKDYA